MSSVRSASTDGEAWLPWARALVDEGLLIPIGPDGLYGRSGAFEDVVRRLQLLIATFDAEGDAEVIRFPPVMGRRNFERTGYVRSFPDQIGSIHVFTGGDRDHAALLHDLDGGRDWSAPLPPAETVLCSAVCHPLYSTVSSPLPPGGRRWNLFGYVFRQEPSVDPARMQCFRQFEYVYVGDGEGAQAHRDRWIERGRELLAVLGLDVVVEEANDPFFGRLGRMLAANQQEDKLKYELMASTGPGGWRGAVASANYHRDHFGAAFELRDANGANAHSACVGFGVERITLALLWIHGLDPAGWPATVRGRLGF